MTQKNFHKYRKLFTEPFAKYRTAAPPLTLVFINSLTIRLLFGIAMIKISPKNNFTKALKYVKVYFQ